VCLAKGKLKEALADCNELIGRDAKDAECLYLRGSVRASQKKWCLAIADFTEAIRLDDGYVDAYKSRATAFEQTGQAKKAKADRDKVAVLGDETADSEDE
jgi:tetratricopeptide (TPR) repeat protein